MPIPKIIHQIWFQGWDKLPAKYLPYVDSIAKLNPDWQIIKWNSDSILALFEKLGEPYLSKYNGFGILHQKIDYARFAILYSLGGVSVDTDAMALRSFNNTPGLSDSDLILSMTSTGKLVNNATIFASQGNDFMKYLLDNIDGDCHGAIEPICIMNTTGPGYFDTAIRNYKGSVRILDPVYLEPCSGLDKYCTIPAIAILDHRHEGTWLPASFRSLKMGLYFLRAHKLMAVLVVLLIILLIFMVSKK